MSGAIRRETESTRIKNQPFKTQVGERMRNQEKKQINRTALNEFVQFVRQVFSPKRIIVSAYTADIRGYQ